MMFMQFIIEIFLIFLNVYFIHGKISSGNLRSSENWHYLDRFCFVSEIGRLHYEIAYPEEYAIQNMYLYYDTPSQWPFVYKSDKSCLEKESVLRRDDYQIVNLSRIAKDRYNWPGCFDTLDKWIRCVGYREFASSRDRWWYIAIGNCNSTKGLYLDYTLTLTNGIKDDFWYYQFSADEFLILPFDIAFLFANLMLLAIAVVIALVLKARQMLHSTYRLFLASLSLELLSLLCSCSNYGKYATDGIGIPFLKLFAQLLNASTELTFVFLLILLAKGYTITRARLSKHGRLRTSIFMSLYMLSFSATFIYNIRFADPGEVLYFYESIPGYILLVLRIVGWAWFCRGIYFTVKQFPEKRVFYLLFASIYSVWFWMGPCLVLIASYLIGKWHRQKIVNGAERIISFLAFGCFLFITRPSAANHNFPYHVRTTQISSLIEKDASGGPINLPHNQYIANDMSVFNVSSVGNSPSPVSEDPFLVTWSKNEPSVAVHKNDQTKQQLA